MGSAQELSHSVSSPSPHVEAIREAWGEFCRAVPSEAYGSDLPAPVAWIAATWKCLVWRFSRRNLERLFRSLKAERRERLDDLRQYVFVMGADEWTDDRWEEVDALVAEFGGDFPPRGYQPMSVAEMVGLGMGYSREEVAAIVST